MVFDILHQARRQREQDDAGRVAERAREATVDLATRLQTVHSQLERLNLLMIATLELLRDRTSLTDAELLSKVEEVDRRDGKANGRLDAPPRPCPSCARCNHALRLACIYCGDRIPLPLA